MTTARLSRHSAAFLVTSSLLFPLPALAIDVIEGAPAGFEALEAPRQSAITLYYGGDVLGTFPAHTMPGFIQFDAPEGILDVMPNISDREKVGAVLAAPMPMHADLLCTEKRTEDCDNLTPEIAGVIYSENELSAELFVAKEYLMVSDPDSTRYLPLPKRDFSSLYSFNGAFNGVDNEAPNFSLGNNATFSLGEFSLNTQTSVTNQGLRFDTAAFTAERRGWNTTAGLFRSRPGMLLGDRDLAGMSVSTSRRTHLNPGRTDGNDIIVYLTRRSFVSIYREGRLYASRAYDAGNQIIDTSDLPDGAYNITLRIQEADGTTREEQRFFAKTMELPPTHEPTYFLQAGVIRKPADSDSTLPELTSDPLIRAGTVRRVSENIGIGFEVTGLDDRVLGETSVYWLMGAGELRATAMGSSKGDKGVQAGYNYTAGRFNVTTDARRIWKGDSASFNYDDMIWDMTQASFTATFAARDNLSFGLRASYYKQAGMTATRSVGPYAEWRIWQDGESILSLNATGTQTDQGSELGTSVHFTRRFGPKYGVSSSASMNVGGASPGPAANARGWYEKRDDTGSDDFFLAGAGLSMDSDTRVVSADMSWQGDMGAVNTTVQQSFGGEDSTVSYGGSFNFNLAQAGGHIKLGGAQGDRAALIVGVDGDAGSDMNIYVNGMKKGDVESGSSNIVYLTPFHVYNVRIKPVEKSLIDYDSGDRKIVVYPGNVVKLDWEVNRFYVVVAQINRPDGTPLANATLKESKTQAATGEDGRIQAELAGSKVMTFEIEDGTSCQVNLPATEEINGVLLYPSHWSAAQSVILLLSKLFTVPYREMHGQIKR